MTNKVDTLAFLALLAVLLLSCKPGATSRERAPHWFDHYTHFHQKEYVEHFQQRLNEDTLFASANEIVHNFYVQREYEPMWTNRGYQESLSDTLIHYLENATQHGIPGKHFKLDQIQQCINNLKEHKYANDKSLYDTLFQLEMTLTDAYLQYAKALQFGATDPKVVNGGKWLYETVYADSLFFVNALAECENLSQALQQFQPSAPEYRRLQKELRRLQALSDTAFVRIPVRAIYKGQQNANLQCVADRLRLTGELKADTTHITTLNDKLLTAINKFRANNAIPTSDSLDRETIEKLNRPISYYTDRLAANMERLRWKIATPKEHTYIAVNVPDFTLTTYVEDTIAFHTRICCGKTQNPKADPSRTRNGLTKAFKSETPLLHSNIGRLVLNPEWNVPYGIIKDEYYYKLCKSNTACINRERMYIKDVRTGKQVEPSTIDWNKVSPNNIPYRLVQSSGRYNALGQIKFDFPNPESVYLHDTNNKGAFKRRVRALSHGCVRVENPFDLAKVIYDLNGYDTLQQEQYSIIVGNEPVTEKGLEYAEKRAEKEQEYYENLSDYGKQFYRAIRPTSVSLKKKMPLYIEYFTCFADKDGQIQYREDIYYKDPNIIFSLNK